MVTSSFKPKPNIQIDDEVKIYDPIDSKWHNETGQIRAIKDTAKGRRYLVRFVGGFSYYQRWYKGNQLKEI